MVLDGLACGGQVLVTDVTENYPGFSDGIRGPELLRLLCGHSSKYVAELKYEQVTQMRDLGKFSETMVAFEGSFSTKALFIAIGGPHKKLESLGEQQFSGRGGPYCDVCDGNLFKGEDVVVVGGGDDALDEGSDLAGIVNQLTVFHRRD